MPQLKVGDKVTEWRDGSIMGIHTISRVTKTTAIFPIYQTECKLKIEYRDSGDVYEIGANKWSHTSYSLTKPGDLEKIRAQNAKGTLANMGNGWYSVADEKVNRILAILNEGK